MHIYSSTVAGWWCGHWNGSPLEIGTSDHMHAVPPHEVCHFHAYHEYYIALKGRGTLRVAGHEASLAEGSVVMVAPGETHQLIWVDPDVGLQMLVIKERSAPDSKVVLPDAACDGSLTDAPVPAIGSGRRGYTEPQPRTTRGRA